MLVYILYLCSFFSNLKRSFARGRVSLTNETGYILDFEAVYQKNYRKVMLLKLFGSCLKKNPT